MQYVQFKKGLLRVYLVLMSTVTIIVSINSWQGFGGQSERNRAAIENENTGLKIQAIKDNPQNNEVSQRAILLIDSTKEEITNEINKVRSIAKKERKDELDVMIEISKKKLSDDNFGIFKKIERDIKTPNGLKDINAAYEQLVRKPQLKKYSYFIDLSKFILRLLLKLAIGWATPLVTYFIMEWVIKGFIKTS